VGTERRDKSGISCSLVVARQLEINEHVRSYEQVFQQYCGSLRMISSRLPIPGELHSGLRILPVLQKKGGRGAVFKTVLRIFQMDVTSQN
jgi:hypothetical protein